MKKFDFFYKNNTILISSSLMFHTIITSLKNNLFFNKKDYFGLSLLKVYNWILCGVFLSGSYFIYSFLNRLEELVVIESFSSVEDFFISYLTCLDIAGFDSFFFSKFGYFSIDSILFFLLFNIFIIGLYYEFSTAFFKIFFQWFSFLVSSLIIFSFFFFFYFDYNLIWIFSQGVLVFDLYGLIGRFLIYIIGFFYFYYSYNYYKLLNIKRFEFLFIKLLIIISFGLLINTCNFLSFYVVFELISLSLYILAASIGVKSKSAEAALKYFILGALSSGFLLVGISLIYGFTGTLNFFEIKTILGLAFSLVDSNLIASNLDWSYKLVFSLPIIIGALSIFISFLFKFAVAPLHLWAIDVYEGVLLPISGFFSIVVKFSFFLAFFRLFLFLFYELSFFFSSFLYYLGILSVVLGCLGALYQNKIISFLVYSSINNVGFIFVSLGLNHFDDLRTSFVYLLFYILNNLIIFIVLTMFCFNTGRSFTFLTDLPALMHRYPFMAWSLVVALLSLAGIPPLSGFFGKFLVLYSLCVQGNFTTYFVLILASCVSTFYYLRVIKILIIDGNKLPLNNSIFLVAKKTNLLGLYLCLFLVVFMYFFLPSIFYSISIWVFSLMHPYMSIFY